MKYGNNEDGSICKIEKEGSACMWQEMRGQPEWRMQTDDPSIVRKLSRKEGMSQVCLGANCYLRVYRFEAASRNNARRTFRRVTGQTPLYDISTRVYSAKTRSGGGVMMRRAA